MSSQNRIGVILAVVVAISALAVVLTHGSGADDGAARDVSVQCGPAQQAVVHRPASAAQPVVVECVQAAPHDAEEVGAARLWTVPGAAVPPAAPATAPAYAPTTVAAAPAVYYPAPSAATTRVDTPGPQRTTTAAHGAQTVSRKPSTGKRLMVIGGSAGAGAGIGALIGGRKGALIGAAIGGGGAAIVDQIRND
jgi:hypothetical protein|nr:MAG: hypothetical protein DIU54_14320 [Acidobacteriota bacterium]